MAAHPGLRTHLLPSERIHGHDERAKKLEGRLDKLHKAHDRVVDRIAKLHARCDAAK
ncbi:MAG: hypothetical protein NVSMB13_16650 [Mycobacteriales bacterium]